MVKLNEIHKVFAALPLSLSPRAWAFLQEASSGIETQIMIEQCSSNFLCFLFTCISIHMDVCIHMAELLPKHFEYPAETFVENNLMNTPYTHTKQIRQTCPLQTRKNGMLPLFHGY